MTTFDKREEGFEKKFALDEEQKFKAHARGNRLLGLWAAEKLGMSGDAATAYARDVVAADFEPGGNGAVRKVSARSRRQRYRTSRGRTPRQGGRTVGAGDRGSGGGEVRRRVASSE